MMQLSRHLICVTHLSKMLIYFLHLLNVAKVSLNSQSGDSAEGDMI